MTTTVSAARTGRPGIDEAGHRLLDSQSGGVGPCVFRTEPLHSMWAGRVSNGMPAAVRSSARRGDADAKTRTLAAVDAILSRRRGPAEVSLPLAASLHGIARAESRRSAYSAQGGVALLMFAYSFLAMTAHNIEAGFQVGFIDQLGNSTAWPS